MAVVRRLALASLPLGLPLGSLLGLLLSSLLGLLLGLAVTGCGEPGTPSSTRPNVLLIVVDTLRADALGVYGATGGDSPVLDRFAEGALVFSQASTPRAKTTPAVASLLTGTYPPEHGVRDLGRPLPSTGTSTVAEAFRAEGYITAAIVGNYCLSRERSGLDRGFDRWIEDFPDAGDSNDVAGSAPERRAPSLTDGALELLPQFDGDPFFLYLHYMDPHGPYDPPAELRVEAGAAELLSVPSDAARFRQPLVAQYNVPANARSADGVIDAAVVRAAYRGEVRAVDRELGRLFAGLRARGLDQNTIVVITADHGESLGEHDYWFEHGQHAYEATCRVPLLVRAPGIGAQALSPEQLARPVSLVDVAPTLRSLALGQALEQVPFHGNSLLVPRPHATFSEKAEGNELARTMQIDAVRSGHWKLVRRFTALGTALEQTGDDRLRARRVLADELYDLAADPFEERDLLAPNGAPPVDAPIAELRAQLERWRAFDDRFGDAPKREPNALERKRLRAMGYMGQ